jgi:hypothetical protein
MSDMTDLLTDYEKVRLAGAAHYNGSHPCPQCGGKAAITGGITPKVGNVVDFIQCVCGYRGVFHDDGVYTDNCDDCIFIF